jgi:hypothetical protein
MFQILKSDRYPGLVLKRRSPKLVTDQQAWNVSLQKCKLILRLCKRGKLIEDGGGELI